MMFSKFATVLALVLVGALVVSVEGQRGDAVDNVVRNV
jgi:hypothetical protein